MNCPYCDMFTPSSRMCVHCGERLPSAPKAKSSRSGSHGLRSGSFMKIILVLILIGVIYGVYSSYFKEGDIPSGNYPSRYLPSYMIHGSVNLEEKLVKGKTNIVDFYSEYCAPCRKVAPLLKKLADKREDIAVIKININRRGVRGIDWQSPVARQFKLKSIPHFIIVSPSGKLLYKGRRAYTFVLDQLRKEGIANSIC